MWRQKRLADCLASPIDCTWVRKWKWVQLEGKGEKIRIVKSRLCARGFLDSQVSKLTTRATTATRLSQRLLVSLGVLFGLSIESWDVTGAFLKGLPFTELTAVLRERGIKAITRHVYIQPPANVWRHLREIETSAINISSWAISLFVLECLKPMYGLGDAPLAFQVVMQIFMLEDLKGQQSRFDECF